MKLKGADIIVRTLIEQNIDTVFGYPGGQILDVYDSLYKYRDEINHVLTMHEQGAAHAADGYARATGRVGVVMATSGPGATNLVTGIATAYLDSVPMVAICGNVPSDQLGTDSFQEIDITGITLPITKHNYIVGSVESLADTIREAFCIAQSGRPGPVLIDVPKDIQVAMCDYEPKEPVVPAEKLVCKDVSAAVDCIKESKRPFIYYGGGAIAAGAEKEILELAERIDAPIGCSLMGISGVPGSHSRFLGMQGMHGHYASSVSMQHADCIIALGVRFNDRVTGNVGKFATRTSIIHVDVDSAEFSKTVRPTYALKGDVKMVVQALLDKLEKKSCPEWWKKIKRNLEKQNQQADMRPGMTPCNILTMLGTYLKPDTPVVTDVGQHQMWTAQYVQFEKTRRFITSGGLGTMGFGIGAAIGAQMGTSTRAVLVTGDGSFSMCMQELATAVSNRVPVVILMMNNGVLGMVRQWQTLFFDKHYSNTELNRTIDYVAFARALGAEGMRVQNLQELQMAFDKAFSSSGPFLIDCLVDKNELVFPMLPPGGSMDDLITGAGELDV
ncbi:MAG: biosynthetic-type acetolactate synthase large subunit [Ruminococcaceae bacterium]|nr:biosynthetic-type acetolactate synthase large subunit [Oscillospiraceae bacterium]